MLHVLNGGATKVERAGVPGEITVWAYVLHDGSLSDVPDLDGFVDYAGHDEVVFWVEHDLFDQMLLLRHLHGLSAIDPGPTRFSLVCRDEYLGPSSPERLHTFFNERHEITRAEIDAGREGWTRFRATDPTALVEWAATTQCRALEFMPAALGRLFEEFPWTRDGLSRTERQALAAVRGGAKRLMDAFVASQRMEEPFFMGDLGFWDVTRRLANISRPLLTPALSDAIRGDEPVTLTGDGRRVLEGAADAVALNGIDRWIGGVHLTPWNCWRWDGASLVP